MGTKHHEWLLGTQTLRGQRASPLVLVCESSEAWVSPCCPRGCRRLPVWRGVRARTSHRRNAASSRNWASSRSCQSDALVCCTTHLLKASVPSCEATAVACARTLAGAAHVWFAQRL